ncbi:MAG: hypothetical protein QNK37_05835 [Acidobacteriota bacterium]|nr:hypothetical protein [Acidobacteriota bacterium]
MKKSAFILIALTAILLSGCTTPGVRYTQNLFEHIPDDPQFLALVNPNDVSNLMELAVRELNFQEIFEGRFEFNTEDLDHYRGVAIEMFDALGIPVENVESIGVLIYYNQPVFLLTGAFQQVDVQNKLTEIGYKQREDGFFDYVYNDQKLSIPADGVMMMATPDLLSDLRDLPKENRLWNRPDFADYRKTSPLDNSVFIWGKPPKDFMQDFPYRDDLGDVSMALKFGRTITMQAVVRVNDPDKAVYLNDILVGIVSIGKGLFGNDQEYGAVFNGIRITQDNKQVTASLVIPANKVADLKERVKKDFINNETSTFDKFEKFMSNF